jgi:2-polyprenyl-3-methyl-5-hydroxy-6-metoxy-1,4-benzoquinol methylase
MDDFGQQTLESMSEAGWYNNWSLNQFSNDIRGEILEIGCGVGNFTKTLLKFGKVTAIDINESYVERTKKVAEGANVGFGDVEKNKFFFKDKKFDTIICINVLEHIKDDLKAIQNLKNLLKEGGKLIIIVPSHQFLYGAIDESISHFRRYNKNDLSKIFNTLGLQILKNKRLNFLGAIGWFIAGRILKDDIVQKNKIQIFNIIGPLFLFPENFVEPPIGISILLIAQRK